MEWIGIALTSCSVTNVVSERYAHGRIDALSAWGHIVLLFFFELTICTFNRYAAISDHHARIVAVQESSAVRQVQGKSPRRIADGF